MTSRPQQTGTATLRSPIFIGGQPRSGTTLFRVLLNRHSHITCGPETKFLADPEFQQWHDRFTDEWIDRVEKYGLDRQAIDHAMAALVDNLFTRYQIRQGKLRWAEKTPNNIVSIAYLFRLFPAAQFIHLIRDPRDVYCSIQDKVRKGKERWAKFTPEYSARHWRNVIETGKEWRSKPARYFELKYEDLVTEPERSMRQTLSFLGECWDPRVLDPHADNAEVCDGFGRQHRPISSDSIGRWRDCLDAHEVGTIETVAGDLMEEFGYALTGHRQ